LPKAEGTLVEGMKAGFDWRLVKQIFVEFFPQFLISIAYAAYAVSTSRNSAASSFSTFINAFGPTFFLLSWARGQTVRIRKQQKLEDEFQLVKNELGSLLALPACSRLFVVHP
jgi:hypothetical protein